MAKSRTAYGTGVNSNTPTYKDFIELTSADFNKFRNIDFTKEPFVSFFIVTIIINYKKKNWQNNKQA